MTYEKIADSGCKGGSCPAVYREVESGDFIVQGFLLPEEVRGELSVAVNEGIVRVPAAVLEQLTRTI